MVDYREIPADELEGKRGRRCGGVVLAGKERSGRIGVRGGKFGGRWECVAGEQSRSSNSSGWRLGCLMEAAIRRQPGSEQRALVNGANAGRAGQAGCSP